MTHMPQNPKPRKPKSDLVLLVLFLGVAALAAGLSALATYRPASFQALRRPAEPPPSAQQAQRDAEQKLAEQKMAMSKAEQVQDAVLPAKAAPSLRPSLQDVPRVHPKASAPSRIAHIDPDPGSGRAPFVPVKVLNEVRPRYPAIARAARIQGPVDVRVLVDEAGLPSKVHVLSGPESLRREAVQAAEAWRFSPARRSGRAVSAPFTIRFDFRLA